MSDIAHAGHKIKSPVGDEAVRTLLERALPVADGAARVLDLGCGTAEWLLRALRLRPSARAVGVDVSERALARAEAAARERGVAERLALHRQEAAAFAAPEPFDLVLSVGAAHAFGGLLPTLAAARSHLAPGGRVLIGDGYWQRPPSPEAVEMLGEYGDLAATLERVAADGWAPVFGHISSQAELDDYEWSCWGSLAAWALDHPEDPDGGAELLSLSEQRRTEWLRGYRDSWGFVTLLLRRTDG